jgi:Outer membrane protein beta-barrel domain
MPPADRRLFVESLRSGCLIAFLFLTILLTQSPTASAQDSPGRFEVGGNFTALRFNQVANFGPGIEGDVNFGRHFALDAAFNWLPASPYEHTIQGLFGGKVGTRTEHFGFFGKVRPGFVSRGDQLREETIILGPAPIISIPNIRFGRLTERALDFGGVVEYYPSKHWALRYDFGDTVVFGEAAKITIIGGPPLITGFPGGNTTHNFQFSTSVHYRF